MIKTELPTGILPLIISVVTAIMTVIATLYANRLIAKLKAVEVKLQVRREMANRLLECRIERYPEIFEQLSNFIKKIDYERLHIEDVKDLLDNINKWDSRNAIFYTSDTAYTSDRLRKFLSGILKSSRQEKDFNFDVIVKETRNQVVEMEIYLRSDLGIYGIDFNKDMSDFVGKSLPPLKLW